MMVIKLPFLAYDDNWSAVYEIDDGVDISAEADIEFLVEIQGNKWVSTTADLDKMKFAHNNILKTRKYVLSLHKIHATSFPEDDLEELLKRWVRKVFTEFHVTTRLCVHHWNNNRARMYYWKFLSKTRSDPYEFFSNKNIIDMVRVKHHEVYGHEQIDEVCVKRNDDKYYNFTESDFKSLNKNDIEDMYYICLRERYNSQLIALRKALIIFIRSCVIWERVHDLQLGIDRTVFRFTPYQFYYPERKLTMEEMLDKFINEGKREHKEMEIFIKELRTTNELQLKEQNNLLSELKIEVHELSKVMSNALVSRFQSNEQDKPKEVVVENEPPNILERTTQSSIEPQQSPIPFSNRSRKEKVEAQQRKFLKNLKQLHINIPFIKALVQMPKYVEYLKSLLTNKSRLKEACIVIMNERCSAVLLNKLPSKEKDPGSFTIPCQVSNLHIDNALADLDMPEDSRIPIILGRPFLATARAMIDVFNTKITLSVRDDEVIFDMDQSMKNPPSEDDECYTNEFIDDPTVDKAIRRINVVDTAYLERQETESYDVLESEHLYSASANEIDEKKPDHKDLPSHLEYAYLHGRYGVSVPALHKKPRRTKELYAVSRRPIYAVSYIE
ncbi:hypothetical protein Tco_0389442 [Tanacetum coccineum]